MTVFFMVDEQPDKIIRRKPKAQLLGGIAAYCPNSPEASSAMLPSRMLGLECCVRLMIAVG